jgi:hypothetical protein
LRALTSSPFLRGLRWHTVAGAVLLQIACFGVYARAQEPAPSSTASPGAMQQPPPGAARSESSSSKHSHGHANDFLIMGTVFTDKALAFPGVRLRVRRSTERKFRWETYTNSRGEFAIRVPQGAEYEMVIIAKGFTDQSKTVSAKSGISEDNVVFQMQPATGGKK